MVAIAKPFDFMMAIGRVCDEYGIVGDDRDEVMCLVGSKANGRPASNALERAFNAEMQAMEERIAKQVSEGTHDELGQPLRFRGHDLTKQQHYKAVEYLQVGLVTPEDFEDQPHPDEALIAQVELLRAELAKVLRLTRFIDPGSFMWPKDQYEMEETMRTAKAALVETER